MLKGLVKLGISGSAVSGVVLIDLQPRNITKNGEKALLEKIKSNVTTIKSIEDIALYEKTHGCNFVFSDSQKTDRLYTGEEFWKQIKNEADTKLGKHSIFDWANGGIEHCKGKVVTIFRKGKDELRMEAPEGGW